MVEEPPTCTNFEVTHCYDTNCVDTNCGYAKPENFENIVSLMKKKTLRESQNAAQRTSHQLSRCQNVLKVCSMSERGMERTFFLFFSGLSPRHGGEMVKKNSPRISLTLLFPAFSDHKKSSLYTPS